ncbi:MAG: fructokinase [Flavobacteriales bacterium]|jgi:fructokinase
MQHYFAVIEAGGTNFNCAIIDADRKILAETRIDTTTPEETLGLVINFFKTQKQDGYDFDVLGLACFGPIDLRSTSTTYGFITATPKPHWSNVAILPQLEKALQCRVYFDTDVNAAALAEYCWGAAQNTEVSVYVTVGTGLGGGVIINGKPLHGLIHPEIGHILLSPPDGIEGVCPFHGNCAEGLASGKAMSQIWQQPAETLNDEHRAWDVEAQMLGLFCHSLLLSFSPQKIILGGGVMYKPGLIEKVIECTKQSLGGYLTLPTDVTLGDIICRPGLGQYSGLLGALALAINGAKS